MHREQSALVLTPLRVRGGEMRLQGLRRVEGPLTGQRRVEKKEMAGRCGAAPLRPLWRP